MNKLDFYLFKLKRFFNGDTVISIVKNDILNMEASHMAARARVKEAKKKFEDIKTHEDKTFEELRKNTLHKTLIAVQDLKDKAEIEKIEVNERHKAAVAKIDENINDANLLEDNIKFLNCKEYPLEK